MQDFTKILAGIRTNPIMSNSVRVYLFVFIGFLAHSSYAQLNFFAPEIVGQRPTPLITEKNTAITIAFGNLRVTDSDLFAPAYPEGYTLKVFPGDNYTLVDATVTPGNNFVGILTVQVQVNDGKFDSNTFNLKIDVTNLQPVITNHEPISIKEGETFTLLHSHLTVSDEDNKYPDDFSLSVFDGSNYSVNGNTIIPDPGFDGSLKVSVSVNDGHEDSDKYEVIIEVRNNIKPTIKGQVPLTRNQGTKIKIQLENLIVDDSDDVYSIGFTLKLYDESNNYSINGDEVIPIPTFTGKLTVPVSVNDGIDESNKYNLVIEVIKKINVRPEITGQDALSTNEDKSLTVSLDNLKVTDSDNTYPADFKLKMLSGENYTLSGAGTVLTPKLNFSGTLEVPTTVTDGEEFSEPYVLKIAVQPINDAPVIKGQNPITIVANTASEIKITSLTVEDPDGPAAKKTIKILSGTNYTFSGATITPATNFTGTLTVRVVVNDGIVDSAPFNLKVEVLPKSVIPVITGQQLLFVNEDESITLKLDDLTVIDDDNSYPTGFTMTVLDGANYTFDRLTITPAPNFNSFLSVDVKVFDGKNWSKDPYPLKIYVIPVNDAPAITALEDTALPYEPGTGPVPLTEIFECIDVDDPEIGYLSFAEIGFQDTTFSHLNDVLIFNNVDTAEIRGIYEPGRGVLSLIGYATIAEYKKAIRSIRYNYQLTEDENGNQSEVIPGSKYIYFKVSDGLLESDTLERVIKIESSVSLDIPNAFTPNTDRFNKTWKIRSVGDANRFDKAIVKVYNKRGLLVYESKGLDKEWDGSFNGEALPVDTYYYTIDLNLSYAQKTFKGVVMILK
jgi:gliding motility-associated-like protein